MASAWYQRLEKESPAVPRSRLPTRSILPVGALTIVVARIAGQAVVALSITYRMPRSVLPILWLASVWRFKKTGLQTEYCEAQRCRENSLAAHFPTLPCTILSA